MQTRNNQSSQTSTYVFILSSSSVPVKFSSAQFFLLTVRSSDLLPRIPHTIQAALNMVGSIAQALLVVGAAGPAPAVPTMSFSQRSRQTRSSTSVLPETPSNNRALTFRVGHIPLPQASTAPNAVNVVSLSEFNLRDGPEKVHLLINTVPPSTAPLTGNNIKDDFRVALVKTLAASGIDMDNKSNFLGVYFFDSQGQASMCYGMNEEVPARTLQTWLGSADDFDFPTVVLVIDKTALTTFTPGFQRGKKDQACIRRYLDNPNHKLRGGPKPPMFEMLVKIEKMETATSLSQTCLDQKEQETNAKDKQIDGLNRRLADYEEHIAGLRGKLSHARDTYLQPKVRGLQEALDESRDQYLAERRGHEETLKANQRNAALISRRLAIVIEGRDDERERHKEEATKLNERINLLETKALALLGENEQLQEETQTLRQEVADIKDAARVVMGGAFY